MDLVDTDTDDADEDNTEGGVLQPTKKNKWKRLRQSPPIDVMTKKPKQQVRGGTTTSTGTSTVDLTESSLDDKVFSITHSAKKRLRKKLDDEVYSIAHGVAKKRLRKKSSSSSSSSTLLKKKEKKRSKKVMDKSTSDRAKKLLVSGETNSNQKMDSSSRLTEPSIQPPSSGNGELKCKVSGNRWSHLSVGPGFTGEEFEFGNWKANCKTTYVVDEL
jgi:hypothetical protein